jgi:hypothetical protein
MRKEETERGTPGGIVRVEKPGRHSGLSKAVRREVVVAVAVVIFLVNDVVKADGCATEDVTIGPAEVTATGAVVAGVTGMTVVAAAPTSATLPSYRQGSASEK